MFDRAFPDALREDLLTVQGVLPAETYNAILKKISDEHIFYTLHGNPIEIPYRMYWADLSDEAYHQLSHLQRMMICCIYTRSYDGYVREKYARKLLDMALESWVIPFLVKLCDEYVIEILDTIYEKLKQRDNEDIREFCLQNRVSIRKSYARMISYWDVFYREDVYDFRQYVGRKLFWECLDYNRTFER